jgi:uncharacterized protein YeaO (DUF488 family)
MTIHTKRVYEKPTKSDGFRILVDRLWPRGLTKQKAQVHLWLKDVAPSTELRQWFGHDPLKWKKFRTLYVRELKKNKSAVELLKHVARQHAVLTLVYGAKDEMHNNAVILEKFLK